MTLVIRTERLELRSTTGAAHASHPFAVFLIVRRSHGDVIGDCGFRAPPDADGVVEVFYKLAPSQRQEGFELEALEALIGFAFTHDEVVSVRAAAPAGDEAARRVLQHAGMMAVGERAGLIHFEA